MKRLLNRTLLDNRFDLRVDWSARRGGGFLIGLKASFPVLVVDDSDLDSHWWMESFGLFGGPFQLYFFFSKRIIPHSPTQLFQEVS